MYYIRSFLFDWSVRILFLIFVFSFAGQRLLERCAFGQSAMGAVSARSVALCGSDIASPRDPSSANPAFFDTTTQVGVDYLPLPNGLDDGYTAAAFGSAALSSEQQASLTAQTERYQSIYSESEVGLSYTHHFPIDSSRSLTAGLRLRYSSEQFTQDYLPLTEWQLDVGANFKLTSDLSAGIAFENLVPLYRSQDETIGIRTTSIGLAFRASPEFLVLASAEKMESQPVDIRGGVEYGLNSTLTLRAGAETLTGLYAFGISFMLHPLELDFALQTHPELGSSLAFSLGYGL